MNKRRTIGEDRLLTMKELVELTGVSKSNIYAAIKDKRFPEPVYISTKTPRFWSSDINDHLNKKMTN
jgi:predicted DNA-binding transcriptional regulator AlpA